MKVIITGATGMVGEGVMLYCLEQPEIEQVLIVSRKNYGLKHAKLKELIVSDFTKANEYAESMKGYDACFYCAGISSVGMKEDEFARITYDTTLAFAKAMVSVNPDMTFIYVSGAGTDSSEKGKVMWARVKGKTENDLAKLPFKQTFSFRPGIMKPVKGQVKVKTLYKVLGPILTPFFPRTTLHLSDVGRAMINATKNGYPKQVVEVSDMKVLCRQ